MPATFVAASFFTGATAFTFTEFAVMYLAGTIDAYLLGSLLAPRPDPADARSQTLIVKSAAEPHKIVYGRTMVGGTLVFMDVLDKYYLAPRNAFGFPEVAEYRKAGLYLNMAVAIAAHEIDGIEEIYVGEDKVFDVDINTGELVLVDSRYVDNIEVLIFNGAQTTASDFITANVDKHYKGNGVLDSTNLTYYSPKGVTAISAGSITINPLLVHSTASPLVWDFNTRFGGKDGTTDTSAGTYNGTYNFTASGFGGVGVPAGGPSWDSSYKLKNTAYLYFRFKHNPELYDQGIPSVRAVIRGKKVYDPRYDMSKTAVTEVSQGSWAPSPQAYSVNDYVTLPSAPGTGKTYICTAAHIATNQAWGEAAFITDFVQNGYWKEAQTNNDPTSWTFSDNWALCLRDYLTSGNFHSRVDNQNTLYGIGIRESDINDDNIIEAANESDILVDLQAGSLSVTAGAYTNSIQTVTVTGDSTDYYLAGEKVLVNSTASIIRTTSPATIYSTGVSDSLSGSIAEHLILIIDSEYNSATNTTTIKYKDNVDRTPTTLKIHSKKFTINGVVNTASTPISILENMLAAGAGKLPFVQGTFLLVPGIYIDPNLKSPALTITSDMLAGPISLQGSLGAQNLINVVKGTAINPANKWEESDFFPQTDASYITEDGGFELSESIRLPYTTSSFDAQRLARIMLQRSREGLSCSVVCNSMGMRFPVGDFVYVNLSDFGWDLENGGKGKIFSITSWTYAENRITIGLREENILAYAWDSTKLTPIPYAPNSKFKAVPDLPDITGLTLQSGTNQLVQLANGTVLPRLKISWDALDLEFNVLIRFTINVYTETGVPTVENKIIEIDSDGQNFFYFTDVKELDSVDVTALSIWDNINYKKSGNISRSLNHTIVGKTANPADIIDLTVAIVDDKIQLDWSDNLELDFNYYEIQEGGTAWDTGTTSVINTSASKHIITGATIGSHTYRIKSVDTSGNKSVNADSKTISVSAPSAPMNTAVSIVLDDVRLTWTAASQGTFSLKGYRIKEGGTGWGDATLVQDIVTTNNYTLSDTWIGNRTYRVAAVDVWGNESVTVDSQVITLVAPNPIINIIQEINTDLVNISWAAPTAPTGLSFSIASYEIREGGINWASANKITTVNSLNYLIPQAWLGSKLYRIKVIDTYGNFSNEYSQYITTTAPAAILDIISVSGSDKVNLSWEPAAPGSFSIAGYIIKYGEVAWNSIPNIDARVDSTEYNTIPPWVGGRTYLIRTVDIWGFESTETTKLITTTGPDPVSGLTHTFLEDSVNLSWGDTSGGSYPLGQYEVREGGAGWNNGDILVAKVKSTNITVEAKWTGSKTFRIKATNIYGEQGNEATRAVTVVAPGVPTISIPLIVGDRGEFTWSMLPQNVGSFPVTNYDIRYDNGSGTFNNATPLIITSTNGFSRKVDWGGNRRFWVSPIDKVGNYSSSPGTQSLVISPPGATSVNPQVIDNNVLLRWNAIIADLPIDFYEVRKGATYAGSTLIGEISGLFAAIFETQSGNFTYWVTGVDSAGNIGTNNNIIAVVSEPPDYILHANSNDNFVDSLPGTLISRTSSNADTNSLGNLILPVYDTDTWQQHFENTSITGTNTNASATVLISSGTPNFITNSTAKVGNKITNITTGATGTVASIQSDTQLTTSTMVGGTPNNNWNNGDTYDLLGWDSFQDIIDDGFPIYAQNTPASAQYEVIYDAGVLLGNMGVTAGVTRSPNSTTGDPVLNLTIATSNFNNNPTGTNDTLDGTGITMSESGTDFTTIAQIGATINNTTTGASGLILSLANGSVTLTSAGLTGGTRQDWQVTDAYQIVNWIIFPQQASDSIKIFTESLRYVRTTVDVVSSAHDNDLIELTNLNLRLDIKEKTEGGKAEFTTGEVSSPGYHRVTFGKAFVDLSSVVVTPRGTGNDVIAVTDFSDAPNPTFFDVYLFKRSDGTLVSGFFSWIIRGF